MRVIEYGANDFDKSAWSTIDNKQPLQVLIRGPRRQPLKRALSYYREYVDARLRGGRKRLTWLKFGYYGFRTPTFWGIYNHAERAGMHITTEDRDDCLVVSFLPNPAGPTTLGRVT